MRSKDYEINVTRVYKSPPFYFEFMREESFHMHAKRAWARSPIPVGQSANGAIFSQLLMKNAPDT